MPEEYRYSRHADGTPALRVCLVLSREQATAPCSAFLVRVLDALSDGQERSARNVAEKVWERVASRCFGHRHGQWQSMGAQLERLRKLGLVDKRVTDSIQNVRRINRRGLAARTPNAKLCNSPEAARPPGEKGTDSK
jgi:hypothetical protein